MLRKHPEILALVIIGLGAFANYGVRKAVQEVDRETFRVRQLVLDPEFGRSTAADAAREGLLVLREALRCLKP